MNSQLKLRSTLSLILGVFFIVARAQAPGDWFNSNYVDDNQMGAAANLAYTLLEGKTPDRTIVVAIIDTGVDIEHEDLRDNLWVNEDEIPGNGIDDDNNGYIDDVHGWSFISGPGGDVEFDNLEFTRVYAGLKNRFESVDPKAVSKADKAEYARYLSMKEQFNSRVNNARAELEEFMEIVELYNFAKQQMDRVFEGEDYTVSDLQSLESDDEIAQHFRDFMVYAMENDFDTILEEGLRQLSNTVLYSYNINLDSRSIVGDNPDDVTERFYGSNRVEGPGAEHGTHVAGIVAASRGNGIGIDGIAPAAKIMSVRAVPDGDERDKDVANAIRYAVDNGAHIINMSFGKSYSPHKALVDEAVRYAELKGVLLVHAAGNSSRNNDRSDNFPNARYSDTGMLCSTWVEVGASGPSLDTLVAEFSNYGKETVDIFAPGVDIESATPSNEYATNSGTSMAAPVVSGVAALVWAYHPELSAAELKSILVDSGTDLRLNRVVVPGDDKKTKFKKLSRSGRVVNAYNALQLAAQRSTK